MIGRVDTIEHSNQGVLLVTEVNYWKTLDYYQVKSQMLIIPVVVVLNIDINILQLILGQSEL